MWLFQNSPLPPYCFPGLSWRIGSVAVTDRAIASDTCRTIIALSFIQPDTTGGVPNCFLVQKFGPRQCQLARWTRRPAHGQFDLMTLIWGRRQPHRCSSHTGMLGQHNHHLTERFVSPPKTTGFVIFLVEVYGFCLFTFLLVRFRRL